MRLIDINKIEHRLKNPNKKRLCNEMDDFITDKDINAYFGQKDKHKIIFWSDLKYKDNIQQLLPKNKDYRIILIGVDSKYNGHWVLITRDNKTITYFNSYGGRIGSSKKK